MPDSLPLRRALLATALSGALVTAALWVGVQVAVADGIAAATSPALTPAEAAERVALGTATAAAAGRTVLVIGTLTTLATATVVTALVIRRQNLNAALAARVESLSHAASEIGGADEAAASSAPSTLSTHGPSTERLIRRLTETQAIIQRRLAKLDSERRRAFHVLDHMTDGVVAVDAERRVLLLNSAARDLLRLNRDLSLGRRLAEVVRIPQIAATVDAVLSGASAGGDTELEYPNDPERFLKFQTIPLSVDGASGVLITVRDESQRRHLERMRREFIANVSHELKTPLAAVKGYAETLQLGAKEDPDTCTHFLTQIGTQVERLERLINDMLQLARAQAGTQHLKLTGLPLGPVLRESLATYQPLAEAREIRMKLLPPDSHATVIADREALLTVTNNLLGNAVRYTPEGGNVELRCHRVEKSWAIVVADDGIGIPAEDQERVFERFYRVEKARDSSRGGTGLGLSIVKNLVQAMGGEVELRSRPGEGSTFEVRLPATDG